MIRRATTVLGSRFRAADESRRLADEIARTDLLICYPSTTVVEAVAAGKPVVMVDLSRRGRRLLPGVQGAETVEDLARMIRNEIARPPRGAGREGLERHLASGVDFAAVVARVSAVLVAARPAMRGSTGEATPTSSSG